MSPQPQKIVLVRHGETPWSLSRQHTGRTDLALTKMGIEQAQSLRERLGGNPGIHVWSSPLQRALSTCKAAGVADEVLILPELMEWDYGVFDGRTTDEIAAEQPGWLVWNASEGLGETLQNVGVRADRVISRILATDGDIMIFSHAHFLRILAARWIGLDPIFGRHWTLEPASVSVLSFEHDTPIIESWNWVLPRISE